ncbi:MAG TPA: biotin/lipoyl-containing protein [Pseudobacteroides sp.]|uniref:biotin/lipoyl-containing protein n=1 Tax=Pseudobacteroides sp. TaxID=1968840 RepID=UPI002F9310FE
MKKYMIKVNGNQYEVEVEEVKVDMAAQVLSEPVKAAPVSAAPAAPASAPAPKKDTAVPQGATTVTAPMPGTILKVNVNSGDAVKKGQVLLILEAMKMENEITAPKDGTIASVNVAKGTAVSAGDVMVSIS